MESASGPKGESKSKRKVVINVPNPFTDMYGRSPTFLIDGDDSLGTTFGCILSTIVIIFMTVITVFYVRRFVLKGESSVSQTQIAEETFGALDLVSSNFFLSIVYQDGRGKTLDYREVEDMLVSVELYEATITQPTVTGDRPTITRTQLMIQPCNEIVTEGNYVGKKEPIGKDARCINFDGEREIKGTSGDSEYKFIEVNINPCPNGSDDCITKGLNAGDTFDTSPKYREVFTALNDLTLTFSFLDASADPDNFDSPISYNINSDYKMRLNMIQTKALDLHFGTFEMVTKYGIFYPTSTSKSSITLQNAFYDSKNRQPGADTDTFTLPSGEERVRNAPYGVIVCQVSNRVVTVEREYETFIDALGNIGGFAETIAYIVAILLIFHTDIRYEQKILNDGLLREKKSEDDADKKEEQSKNPLEKTVTYNALNTEGQPITYEKKYKVTPFELTPDRKTRRGGDTPTASCSYSSIASAVQERPTGRTNTKRTFPPSKMSWISGV